MRTKSIQTAARRSAIAVLGTVIALVAAVHLGPASADHLTVSAVQGSAFGYWSDNISLFGGPQPDTGPTPTVTLAADASNSPQSASAPCGQVGYGPAVLFTSDTITVSTAGSLGVGGSVNTTSSITNLNKKTNTTCTMATGGEILTADSLSGSASAGEPGLVGSTTVTGGIVDVHSNSFNCTSLATSCGGHTHPPDDPLTPLDESLGQVPVPTNPPVNYVVEGHVHLNDSTTDYYVIAFNEQTTSGGAITVTPVHEYFGAKLSANPSGAYVDGAGNRYDIVRDPPYNGTPTGGSILQGDLFLGRVTAGATATPTPTTTTQAPTTTTTTEPPTTTTTAPPTVADISVDGTGPAELPTSTPKVPSVGSYSFTVTNSATSPDTAQGVTLNITLAGVRASPSNVQSADGTCVLLKGKTKGVNCDFGTLAPGETATATFDVKAPTKPGTLTLTGTASTTSNDPVTSNNTGSVTTTYTKA